MAIHHRITHYAADNAMHGAALLCPRPQGRGNRRCFCPSVRLSVCPSAEYLANNSRTQRPSVPKFGMKVPHLNATRTSVSRSNGQRSGLQTAGAYRVGRTTLLILACTNSPYKCTSTDLHKTPDNFVCPSVCHIVICVKTLNGRIELWFAERISFPCSIL